MTLNRRYFTAALLIAPLLTAQSRPDFTGTWKLNVAESDYAGGKGVHDPTVQMAPPESLTRVVKQKGNKLDYRVERVIQGRKYEFEVDLDIGGGEFSSNAAGLVSAAWQGDSLVITTVYNPRRERTERTEVWTLSPDRRKLIDEMTFKDAEGKESKVRRVFDRAE
jgi:hypothetical protein